MKIISFSDLHGDYSLYRWIAELAGRLKPDLLTFSGDLFGFPDGYESLESAQNADAQKLESALAVIPIPTIFIMGNDDFITFKPRISQLHHLQSSYQFNGFNFIGYEYSLPFMGGIFEKSEQEISSDLERLSGLVTEKTILISHSPAYGIQDRSRSGVHCGSRSILKFIKQHNIHAHIHGHVHESFGQNGIHFNCASGGTKRAMLIDMETLNFEVLG